jgi:hypothetical protein
MGLDMRDSTAYPVVLGATIGRIHGLLVKAMNCACKFLVTILKGELVVKVGREVTSLLAFSNL